MEIIAGAAKNLSVRSQQAVDVGLFAGFSLSCAERYSFGPTSTPDRSRGQPPASFLSGEVVTIIGYPAQTRQAESRNSLAPSGLEEGSSSLEICFP
ncbi:hypothetical protein [Mesorhizobium carmichaelinearum]|uniref:hypothetical protein n=1 Tax=Mesorhizobium carmichaelinearum TaxID=1208188 RepID=UPI000BA3B67B|nr:hypothetical protein [Mesorhizobium carmichaelinearum]